MIPYLPPLNSEATIVALSMSLSGRLVLITIDGFSPTAACIELSETMKSIQQGENNFSSNVFIGYKFIKYYWYNDIKKLTLEPDCEVLKPDKFYYFY